MPKYLIFGAGTGSKMT